MDSFEYIKNLRITTEIMYKCALPMAYILGNIGNIISALIFSKKSWRKNVCVFYFNICLLINTCHINSNELGMMLNNSFHIYLQNTSNFLCKMYIYTSLLFTTLLPMVLILASIDRLLISSQNVDTRLYSSKRLAYFSISIITIIWVIYYIHVLIKVSIQELFPFYFMCYFEYSTIYLDFVSYSLAAVNLIGCLVMIILCILAFKNVRRIRAVPREKRTHQIRSMTKKDFQLLRCLYVQDIIYIIFSLMITIYNAYVAFTKNQIRTPLEEAIRTFLSDLFTFLFTIPYTSNFLVFAIVSKAFRHDLKRGFYKIFGKNLAPLREEDHRQENIGRDNADLNVVVVSTIELPA